MKIKGLAGVMREIKNLEKNANKATNRGLAKVARMIQSDAKAKVPVDQGVLKNSINIELLPEEIKAKIYASAKYAPYQEFGAGPFTEVPAGYEDYAMEFFVNGKGTTRPQPFLFPAAFKNIDKLVPLVEEELNKMYAKSR